MIKTKKIYTRIYIEERYIKKYIKYLKKNKWKKNI